MKSHKMLQQRKLLVYKIHSNNLQHLHRKYLQRSTRSNQYPKVAISVIHSKCDPALTQVLAARMLL
jgi:hypothetical protein